MSRVLITPRAPTRALCEFGQSASSVAGQRVGRVRRRRPARRIRWLRVLASAGAAVATAAAVVDGAGRRRTHPSPYVQRPESEG